MFYFVTLQTAVYMTSNDTNINEYRNGKDAERAAMPEIENKLWK
jgi:hypothetical protein